MLQAGPAQLQAPTLVLLRLAVEEPLRFRLPLLATALRNARLLHRNLP